MRQRSRQTGSHLFEAVSLEEQGVPALLLNEDWTRSEELEHAYTHKKPPGSYYCICDLAGSMVGCCQFLGIFFLQLRQNDYTGIKPFFCGWELLPSTAWLNSSWPGGIVLNGSLFWQQSLALLSTSWKVGKCHPQVARKQGPEGPSLETALVRGTAKPSSDLLWGVAAVSVLFQGTLSAVSQSWVISALGISDLWLSPDAGCGSLLNGGCVYMI